MAKYPIKLPEYASDKFVDREDEVSLVVETAHQLTGGATVDKRTIIFVGERGTGKSWLLAQVSGQMKRSKGIVVLALNLADYMGRDPIFAVMEMLKGLGSKVLPGLKVAGSTPAEMSRGLMQEVHHILEKQPLALLVDSVYESDWKLLAALEDYLLGPLAVEPNVLIVMAGRGRLYPWKTPELRLKADFRDLKPFEKEKTTTEQLERQKPEAVPRASKIHELSGGNPLANFLLAAHEDPAKALDSVMSGMLETVPADRRRIVRDYLEALCVLRSFDEERVPTMLATCYNDPVYSTWSYPQAREVRQEIVKWAFARWDEVQGGYAIDKSIRGLIEQYLKAKNAAKWEALHCAAYQLYGKWITEYPRARERWQAEADYHTDRLREVGLSPTNCSKSKSQVAATTVTAARF